MRRLSPWLYPALHALGVGLAVAAIAREDLPYLDLRPIFRAVPPLPDGDRHLYHRQDTHLNVRGNRVAGEQLAEFLHRHLPTPPSRDTLDS